MKLFLIVKDDMIFSFYFLSKSGKRLYVSSTHSYECQNDCEILLRNWIKQTIFLRIVSK